nr:unnamed protein product [Spirometra erinaceieuropaei]
MSMLQVFVGLALCALLVCSQQPRVETEDLDLDDVAEMQLLMEILGKASTTPPVDRLESPTPMPVGGIGSLACSVMNTTTESSPGRQTPDAPHRSRPRPIECPRYQPLHGAKRTMTDEEMAAPEFRSVVNKSLIDLKNQSDGCFEYDLVEVKEATKQIVADTRSLTSAELSLLSKGRKFSHTDAAPTNFLANLESILLTSTVPEDIRADIRSCATGLLRQKKHHQVLPIDEEKGLHSLNTDDSIVNVSADKGGATVIMEKSDYVNKANQVFNDREAYATLADDPTKKQAAAVKKRVNELTRLKLITPDDSKRMILNDPRKAHAYGLP